MNLEWLDLSFNKIEKILYLYLFNYAIKGLVYHVSRKPREPGVVSISISLNALLKDLFTMFSRKPREPGVVGPELQQD